MNLTRRSFIQGVLAAATIGYQLLGTLPQSRLKPWRNHFYSNSYVLRRDYSGRPIKLAVIDYDDESREVLLEDGTIEAWAPFAIAYANTYKGTPFPPEWDSSRRKVLRCGQEAVRV